MNDVSAWFFLITKESQPRVGVYNECKSAQALALSKNEQVRPSPPLCCNAGVVNAWFQEWECSDFEKIRELCRLGSASEQILVGSCGRRKIFSNSILSRCDGEQTRSAEILSKQATIEYYILEELGDVHTSAFCYSFLCE